MKKIIALPLILMLSIFTACGLANETPAAGNNGSASQTFSEEKEEASKPVTTPAVISTIKIAGSTSVAPLMKELAYQYENITDIKIEIQETGSSAGINATLEGAAHLGMSSRDLSKEEIEKGLNYTEIALDGIAIIVNPENPIASLSSEEISQIFKGEIKNWSELGGNDGAINVISREEGSGTRGAFEELMGLEGKVEKDGQSLTVSLVTDDATFENSTGAIKLSVSVDINAIGYISLGSMDDSVAAMEVDGAQCNAENVKNKSYPVARPFIICYTGELAPEVQNLMDYILSDEGQSIVLENNYIEVN